VWRKADSTALKSVTYDSELLLPALRSKHP
jgi:hypothetical protein